MKLAGQNEAGHVGLSCASLNEAEGKSLEAREARASVAAGASVWALAAIAMTAIAIAPQIRLCEESEMSAQGHAVNCQMAAISRTQLNDLKQREAKWANSQSIDPEVMQLALSSEGKKDSRVGKACLAAGKLRWTRASTWQLVAGGKTASSFSHLAQSSLDLPC